MDNQPGQPVLKTSGQFDAQYPIRRKRGGSPHPSETKYQYPRKCRNV
jgi:hypothetical protein